RPMGKGIGLLPLSVSPAPARRVSPELLVTCQISLNPACVARLLGLVTVAVRGVGAPTWLTEGRPLNVAVGGGLSSVVGACPVKLVPLEGETASASGKVAGPSSMPRDWSSSQVKVTLAPVAALAWPSIVQV